MSTNQGLLIKYEDTIKEELNVKEIEFLPTDGKIKKIYKPVGSAISSKFGKDTGNVIRFGKMGNIKELGDGQIKVIGEGQEWILDKEDYELVYQGLDENNTAVDGDMIVKFDLEITPELKLEGIAREISRFLNQMRKESDCSVEAKVEMFYQTDSAELKNVISNFDEFLKTEALLSNIESKDSDGDIKSVFNLEEHTASFVLRK